MWVGVLLASLPLFNNPPLCSFFEEGFCFLPGFSSFNPLIYGGELLCMCVHWLWCVK